MTAPTHNGNVIHAAGHKVTSLPPVWLSIEGRSWRFHDYLTPGQARELAAELLAGADESEQLAEAA